MAKICVGVPEIDLVRKSAAAPTLNNIGRRDACPPKHNLPAMLDMGVHYTAGEWVNAGTMPHPEQKRK